MNRRFILQLCLTFIDREEIWNSVIVIGWILVLIKLGFFTPWQFPLISMGASARKKRKMFLFLVLMLVLISEHSRPQRPRSFWSAPRIATSGQVQRHSGFEWIWKHNRLRPEPIRFVRLDSEHAQSDGKSVNRGLPLLDSARVAILGADQKERGLWGRECCLGYCHTGSPHIRRLEYE